jgi:hypothetical protein
MTAQKNKVTAIHDLGISSKGFVLSKVSRYFNIGINHENNITKIRVVTIEVSTPNRMNISFLCFFMMAKLFLKNNFISAKDEDELFLCKVSNVFILNAPLKNMQ